MYGSAFQLEQSINSKRLQNEEAFKVKTQNTPKKSWIGIFMIVSLLAFSSASMAGSKQPKLAGGNGNANGR